MTAGSIGFASLVAGAVLGVVATELYNTTKSAAKKASSFRAELEILQFTLGNVTPKIYQIDQLISENAQSFPREVLEEIQRFKLLLVKAKALVMTCSEIPSYRIVKKYRYARKIRSLNESLGNLAIVQLLQSEVIIRLLTQTNQMNQELLAW